AGQGKPLRVVADQRCTPSYTVDVATATVALLKKDVRGLVHVTNAGSCTWHELASAVFELSGMDVPVTPITSAEFGAAARRPAYSVLTSAVWQRLSLDPPRPWRHALAAYLEERKGRRSG